MIVKVNEREFVMDGTEPTEDQIEFKIDLKPIMKTLPFIGVSYLIINSITSESFMLNITNTLSGGTTLYYSVGFLILIPISKSIFNIIKEKFVFKSEWIGITADCLSKLSEYFFYFKAFQPILSQLMQLFRL